MDIKETNEKLRAAINLLISQGWIKTQIGKTLLGDNGQGHVNHWLKVDGLKTNDFGIKPLSTIANQVKHDCHVVILPRETDPAIIEQLNQYNTEFIQTLYNAIDEYLRKGKSSDIKLVRKTKNKTDEVLDDLLGIAIEESGIDEDDLCDEEKE